MEDQLNQLDAINGLILASEGRQLAKMAADIHPNFAIVELGSHRGLSSCWLAYGARGAHVTCVDPWPQYNPHYPVIAPNDAPWDEDGALERWMANIDSLKLWPMVTPIRSTAIAVAKTWAKPVGLWFHDADHHYNAVRDDFLAWKPYLVNGAWLAVHDFYEGLPDGNGGWIRTEVEQAAVREHILPSGRFTDVSVIDGLWVGRRWFE